MKLRAPNLIHGTHIESPLPANRQRPHRPERRVPVEEVLPVLNGSNPSWLRWLTKFPKETVGFTN